MIEYEYLNVGGKDKKGLHYEICSLPVTRLDPLKCHLSLVTQVGLLNR